MSAATTNCPHCGAPPKDPSHACGCIFYIHGKVEENAYLNASLRAQEETRKRAAQVLQAEQQEQKKMEAIPKLKTLGRLSVLFRGYYLVNRQSGDPTNELNQALADAQVSATDIVSIVWNSFNNDEKYGADIFYTKQ